MDRKFKGPGIQLITSTKPIANYVKIVRIRNLLYPDGFGPILTGKAGTDINVKQGYDDAREMGISIFSILKDELGNLNRGKHIISILGIVNLQITLELLMALKI